MFWLLENLKLVCGSHVQFFSLFLLLVDSLLSNKMGFVWHCLLFCSARAIGWLTAAARRANQSAAAEELSAIRGTAQESFNTEQREGAERSGSHFPKNRTQWPIWVSFVPKGILHFPHLSRTMIKLWFLLLKDWEEGRECTGCNTLWHFEPFFLCLESIFVLTRSWHTHIIVFIFLKWKVTKCCE